MMSKVGLIIAREYQTRVRKKSFIILTLIGPLLFAAMFILPVWFATMGSDEVKTIAVVDSTNILYRSIPDTKQLKFQYIQNGDIQQLKENFSSMKYYAVLYIPHIVTYSPESVQLYSDKQPSSSVVMHIANSLEKEIRNEKLKTYNIENIENILQSVETHITVRTIKLEKGGGEKESHSSINRWVAYFAGFLIYLFIFMFGAQVMRGVIEEKTNRIVEVIITSVRPFQIMMGKIVGIALVALTQFVLWIVLTLSIITVTNKVMFPDTSEIVKNAAPQNIMSENADLTTTNTYQTGTIEPQIKEDIPEVTKLVEKLQTINWTLMIGSFIFFFLGGYLLYGSLFAAIGSVVDSETDTQQFMFPVTIPLILALLIMIQALENPDSTLSIWSSIIPVTSPIVMMARIPYGVPIWQFLLSAGLLILTFIGTTWLAGKIYRTGILMYGKKASYKEIWKWIRYK